MIQDIHIIWQPLAGSQQLALTSPADDTLHEGSRGGGKTDVQLMKFRRFVGQGYGQFWRGIIFDREYKSLDDIINKSKRWFPQFKDGAKFLSSQGQLKWVWPTGEELLFRHMKKESDYDNYHGHEYPYIGWNELTKYPTSACFDAMMSCNRSSFIPEIHTPKDVHGRFLTANRLPLPEIPLIVHSTTNPYGAGHNWVKRKYIDPTKAGQIVRNHTEVFNPRTQKIETVRRTRVRLFSSYKENIYLSPLYVAELENISDPNKRAAWLEGDWDVTAGGAFDDLWKKSTHQVPRFKVPKGWKVTRSFDWGSSHPFSVGWWAISTGEEVEMPDGSTRCFPKGSLIRCHELYGAMSFNRQRFGHNKGCKKSAREIAKEINEIEAKLVKEGWVPSLPVAGPADGQIYGVNEKESGSIASKMEEEGVYWYAADKKAGSRVNGFELVRDMMNCAAKGEGAGLYVMDHCEAFIETVPTLPRDEDKPDDVDTEAEDHVYDDTRYMVLDEKPDWADRIDFDFNPAGG